MKESVLWEELSSVEFKACIAKSKNVCVLPIGVLEKHGDHLPLGTDLEG
jgi:creatinine amidohydrolase